MDPQAVQEGYVTSEPYTVAQQGHFTPLVFLLADQGYPSYASMVLASNQMIAGNPAAIRAFVEASAVGWREYLHGDPSPADKLILKDNPDMTEDVLAQARDKMRQYGIVDGGDVATLGYGAMSDAHWRQFFQIVSKQGAANYQNAFTLAFLPNPPVK
jgi:NitT/TauT family transport system substrate-binding protein